jgi:hypothetical protein
MGSKIVINSILKLTYENGMPKSLVKGEKHKFQLSGERLFQFAPTLVMLVHEIDAKWKFIGQVFITKQTIDVENHLTTGEYKIIKLFSEEVSRIITLQEAPEGESYYMNLEE